MTGKYLFIAAFVALIAVALGWLILDAKKQENRQARARAKRSKNASRNLHGSSDNTGAIVATSVGISSTSSCSTSSDSSGCM